MTNTRAERDNWYYYIRGNHGVISVTATTEKGTWFDDYRYEIGNYFTVEEDAINVMKRIFLLFDGAAIDISYTC